MGSGFFDRRMLARRSFVLLTAVLLILSGLSSAVVPSPAAAQETQIPYGNVIVLLQDGVDASLFASASGVSPAFVYDNLITGFAANLTPEAARRLAQVPQVKGIFPDLPVDPTVQIIPTGVERVNAPRNPFQPFTNGSGGSVGGTVAVVDSGVASLADLNVVGGFNCTSADPNDWGDGFGHGTHVAGSLGAINNDDGVVGVAPGVGIFSARMLNSFGSGSQSQLICALEAVDAQANIRVANLSLTTDDSSPGTCGVNASPLHQAICNLVAGGTSVVVAAGNDGLQVTANMMAGYPEVIAVSAFNDFDGRPGALSSSLCASGGGDDTFWASSSWGSLVDIMGPGVCIRSYNQAGTEVYRSGTSMATPHVAGALALYYFANPGASVSGARSWLLGTAARSQSGAGVSGGRSGEPVLSLGADLATPTPTSTATGTPPTSTPTRTGTRTPTSPAGLGPGVVGRVTTGLNLRETPSSSGTVIAVLPTNTQVLVTGYSVTSGSITYIPVSTSFGNGWVAYQYVDVIGTATPTRTGTATRTATGTRTPTATRTTTGSPTTTQTPSLTTSPSLTPTASATVPSSTPTVTRTPSRTATTPSGWAAGSTVRTTTSVNMRSGPGTNNGVIAVLPTNTTGTVVSGPVSASGYQWYQVNMGSFGTGWVASDFLTLVSGPGATATPTRTTGPATATRTRTATRTATTATGGFPVGSTVMVTEALNMRSGPSTGNPVIALLPAGTTCTVLAGPTAASGFQWYQLNCGSGRVGWAVANWLSQVSAASVDQPSSIPEPSATSDATEAISSETPAPAETPTPTETAVPTEQQTPTSTAIEESPTETPTLEAELPELSPSPSEAAVEPEAISTDVPILDPQPLPIARIQRSEGSSAGQVLVDRDSSTVWMTDGSAIVPLAAFIVDLDAPQYVSLVRWQVDLNGLAGTLHVSVSTDNENWTDLTIDSVASPGEWQELFVDTSVQYIRFVFVNDDGLPAVGGIAEIEVWP